jgi:hypothetical protein
MADGKSGACMEGERKKDTEILRLVVFSKIVDTLLSIEWFIPRGNKEVTSVAVPRSHHDNHL